MEEVMKVLLGNPEMLEPMVKGYVEKYKPSVYLLCNIVLDIANDYANNKRSFETTAKIKKAQYDAYIEAGFSSEQAMSFLIYNMQNLEKTLANSVKNINTNKSSK